MSEILAQARLINPRDLPVPDWVLAGASLDIDFENNRAWDGGGEELPGDILTCSRASVGMAQKLQAVGGISDAIGNTLIAIDDLAGWMNEHVVDTRFSTLFGIPGTDAPGKNSPEFRQFAEGFKSLRQPDTATGGLVRGGAAFIAGLIPAARGIKALGAGAAVANTAGGAISSFLTMAADDPGLSNLVKEHPALANPVTDFLATTPGDNAALNRFKHALEGLGLGALTDGFIKAVVLVKAARAAKVQPGTALAPDAIAPSPTLTPEQRLIQPTDPNASPRTTTAPAPASVAKSGARRGYLRARQSKCAGS